ncbi:MAG: DUF3187 family protein [Thermoanaerobaculia bacterium]
MRKSATRFACLVGLVLVFASRAPAAEDFEFTGPLRLSDQFLLTGGAMPVEPLPLDLLEAGSWQAEVMVSMANTFARSESVQRALEARTERLPVTPEFLARVERESENGEPLFFIDGESLRTELRLRRGLGNGLELEVRLPFLEIQGGWMDGLLEEFHDVAGFDQDGRLGVPKDQRAVFLQLEEGDLLRDPKQSLDLADPLLAIRGQRRLAKNERRLIWDAAIKLPLGDDERFGSSGSVDVAGQAQVSRCKRRSCRFAALNLRYLGEWKLLGLGERLIPGIYAGWERRWRRVSWVVQLMIAGSPLDGIRIEDLHSEIWQLSGGLQWRLGKYGMTAAVTENVAHFENGPDLTLHWAVRRGF